MYKGPKKLKKLAQHILSPDSSSKKVLTYQRLLHFCLHIDQKTNKQNFELRKIESMTHILWIDIEFLNLATILRHRKATFTIVVSYYGHCGNRHNHCRKGAHSIGRVLIVSTPFPQCPSKLTTIVNVATETS